MGLFDQIKSFLGIVKKSTVNNLPTTSQHYYDRVATFTQENIHGGTFLIGDSITEMWDYVDSDNNKYTSYLKTPIINRGIAGDITYGVVNRMGNIISESPNSAFLLIGTNNLGWGTAAAINRIIPDIDNIIGLLLMANCKVYLQSLLPYNPNYQSAITSVLASRNSQHIPTINQALYNLSIAKYKDKITFIDLYPHFLDSSGLYLDVQYSIDGLHLSSSGYKVWANILNQYL